MYGHARQAEATLERTIANARNALWDGHALQGAATLERTIANARYTIGDMNRNKIFDKIFAL